MKKNINNKGFSLIELLVVIAIMAVMVALVSISYSIVHGANVENSMNTLGSAFNKAKVISMAKGMEAGKLKIAFDGEELKLYIGNDTNGEIICNGMQDVFVDNLSTIGSECILDYRNAYNDCVIEYCFNPDGSINMTESSVTGGSVLPYVPTRFSFIRGKRGSQVVMYQETGKQVSTKFLKD